MMPNMNWSKLSSLQLGKYGEYYAKMEFASYGYDIYTSEVDDHGVDFVARNIDTRDFFEVQVKSLLKSDYTFIKKNKLCMDEHHLVCFLHFKDGELPEVYIIPATAWKNPNAVLKDHDYDEPEWGIQYSQKNVQLLTKYKVENYFKTEV